MRDGDQVGGGRGHPVPLPSGDSEQLLPPTCHRCPWIDALRGKARGPHCAQGVGGGCCARRQAQSFCPECYRELWALQKEVALRLGGELPVTRGVHQELGEHPWSWFGVIPAQVGGELGGRGPFWVFKSKELQSSPRGHEALLGGSRVWEPMCHAWATLAWPPLKISNKSGLLQTDPGKSSLKGTIPAGGK